MMKRLEPLVGEWRLEAFVEGQSMGLARMRSEWIEDGWYLRQHTSTEPGALASTEWARNSPFPVTSIIGLDDTAQSFTMLYADGRGVSRVYSLDVADGVWRMWRAAPGFHQRFAGTISADGRTIDGAWEGSADGDTWALDFRLTYTKVD